MITCNRTIFFLLTIFLANMISSTLSSVVSTGNFNQDFYVPWAPDHVKTSTDGHWRSLTLDQQSGSAMVSNDLYMFGEIDMQIKLIPGYSAGTVVAFYLSSNGTNDRDEIDFEFLGNVSGQPYILQTNVYVDGYDNSEERIYLWFDPTKEFHSYSILWNINQIVFMVDWVPIRTYRNHADKGAPFPQFKPMSLKASLWNGDNWATRGGKDKVDWSKGPFVASFRNYKIDACIWKGIPSLCRAASPTNWWNLPKSSSLTWTQRKLFKWARKYHLIYDYCQDQERFQGHLPRECSLPKY